MRFDRWERRSPRSGRNGDRSGFTAIFATRLASPGGILLVELTFGDRPVEPPFRGTGNFVRPHGRQGCAFDPAAFYSGQSVLVQALGAKVVSNAIETLLIENLRKNGRPYDC